MKYAPAAVVLLPLLFVAVALPAHAHEVRIKAVIALEPAESRPMVQRVGLQLLDYYDNPIAGAQISARVGAGLDDPTFALAEAEAGQYRGELRLPPQRTASVRITAVLPDGPWVGWIKIRANAGVQRPQNRLIALRHGDAPFITPAGGIIIGVIAFGTLLGLRWIVQDFRTRTRRKTA